MEAVRCQSSYGVMALIFIDRLVGTQAWREKNEGLATFMADKVTGSNPGAQINEYS